MTKVKDCFCVAYEQRIIITMISNKRQAVSIFFNKEAL